MWNIGKMVFKNIKGVTMKIIRLSSRDSVVTHNGWSMTYLPDGWYRIYKKGKEVASGKYDATVSDSYNNQMSKEDREEGLTRDLVSWIEKTVKGRVAN